MKITFATILLLSSLVCLRAQTWSGVTPGNIYYNAGNVGIGSAPTTSRLHIAEGAGGEQLRFTRGTGVVRFAQDNNQDNLYLFNRDGLKTFMSWNANGNVGIGVNTPIGKLQVADGPGGEQLRLTRGTGHVLFVQDNNIDNLYLFNRDKSKTFMSWNTNGNVGIGVNAAAAKLHIADGNGGEQLRLSRGTGQVFLAQDANLDNLFLFNHDGSKTYMSWGSTGNIGIGIKYPTAKLHIADGNGGEQLRITRGTGQVFFAQDNNQDNLYLFNSDGSKAYMYWRQDGFVGIGTKTPDAKLTVAGDIHSREVRVTVDAGADFVFQDDYKLQPLSEVEKFIDEHKHLPEIESASEMERNGLELGKMDIKLLQKVEELTLYLIKLEKEMEQMKAENQKLKNRVGELENR